MNIVDDVCNSLSLTLPLKELKLFIVPKYYYFYYDEDVSLHLQLID